MKVFISGGTGMLGSHIAAQLAIQGHETTLLARNMEKGRVLENLPGVRLLEGSYTDTALLQKELPGHDACVTTVLTWGEGGLAMLDNDTRPTIHLAELAAAAGVTQFLYTSSTAALGEFRKSMDEEMISRPIDHYCATKRATELFLLGLSYKSSMRCNIIRPGAFFGEPVIPGARFHRGTVMERLTTLAMKGMPIEVMENRGTQYLAVNDLARVFVAVLNVEMNREIFFALGKPWYSEELIAREANKITGGDSPILLLPNSDPNPPTLFTLDKIKDRFGFEFDSWPYIVSFIKFLSENRGMGLEKPAG